MDKVKIKYLDIPIIRSCNLSCAGCFTFSDHKRINGVVRVGESREWLKFWSERIAPTVSISLFGGEPLMHPELTEWVYTVREFWGNKITINVNTNGWYLDQLANKVGEFFKDGQGASLHVSIQSGEEPYLSKVTNNVELFKAKAIDYFLSRPNVGTAAWVLQIDEGEEGWKKWYRLYVNGRQTNTVFTVCEQYKLPWCSHYSGRTPDITPHNDYGADEYVTNHSYCQAKEYVTLYRGRLYKCPPIGVLEHTLNTFGLVGTQAWAPYMREYKSVGVESAMEDIVEWVTAQQFPEKVCNMCGFSGNNSEIDPESGVFKNREHIIKQDWQFRG